MGLKEIKQCYFSKKNVSRLKTDMPEDEKYVN
jgi:hypothetical protein